MKNQILSARVIPTDSNIGGYGLTFLNLKYGIGEIIKLRKNRAYDCTIFNGSCTLKSRCKTMKECISFFVNNIA